MPTLAEAQAAMRARIVCGTALDVIALAEAAGRFVARPLAAHVDNPAFDNSAMDGYALRHADLAPAGFRLPLAGESSCGDAPTVLAPGTAMRIFTGAPVPEGADTVVMQEEVTVADARAQFPRSVKPGDHLRRCGEDFRAGEALFEAGHRLTAYDMALLAAAGVARVPVLARPRALVVATGSELVAPGEPLAPGKIYESNRLATLLQLRELGIDAVDGGTVRDDAAALRSLLENAGAYDFVITSGGASVGDHDLVKRIFGELGTIDFWKVRIKPGKPVAFGRIGERTHFFALPGNPVSSLITFKLFVEPALFAWHGAPWALTLLNATATRAFRRSPGRMEFLRARLHAESGRLFAEPLKGQGSHMLGTLRETNGLICVEEERAEIGEGDEVRVLPLGRLELL